MTDNVTTAAARRAIGLPSIRLGALIALGLAAFAVAWLALRGGDGSQPAASQPAGASTAELEELAASVTHPVYWAGPETGKTYELTRTSDGRIYVRYLPEGVQPGDRRAEFLTVGTYPRPNAFAELKRAARAKGAVSLDLERGGLLVYSEGKPTSVHFGYPRARYQVEVYHPSPQVARRLVLAGEIVPVR